MSGASKHRGFSESALGFVVGGRDDLHERCFQDDDLTTTSIVRNRLTIPSGDDEDITR